MANFYSKKVEEVLAELKTSLSGLSSQEAQKRLSEHGFNELQEKKEETLLQMFIDQFKDFMIVILIIAAVVSAFVGEFTDAIVIIAIVILNALLGVIQENRANKALKALKKMTKPNAKVIRDGKVQVIPTRELVPGDIVVLEAGDFVPADGRLIEVANLK
ncbi:MAG TPA: cation-transporting P-type ATPase, partial [Fervidobacterium sp.]|nr:cation-transporting P-type ATPase [Fervidobacterium sp.]